VVVIQDGVLKNFLMSRMPIKGFDKSNGHGRNQPGLMPTGRQGNLIVTSNQTVPEKQLRQMLIDEAKKQGKPYGLYFDDIQGGFTLTTRSLPQAFQVLPVIVYKVYADGRPDELVRGVDIVGTPLAALTRIITTGDTQHVFNGVCGAEAGACRCRRWLRQCCSARWKCRNERMEENGRRFCRRREWMAARMMRRG